mmetsp:Transcript_5516/g.16332  ORF Transcript_5516/g.16332 Transcript_5516/m.16332 type:complete len:175 (-) Transcript_5516:220-744(-)
MFDDESEPQAPGDASSNSHFGSSASDARVMPGARGRAEDESETPTPDDASSTRNFGGSASDSQEDTSLNAEGKRPKAIAMLKRQQNYQEWTRLPRSGPKLRAQTPDPADRSVSNRQWEHYLRLWKRALAVDLHQADAAAAAAAAAAARQPRRQPHASQFAETGRWWPRQNNSRW